jgi:hypothetical protein
MTDTELRIKAMSILSKTIGNVEAERFISLMIREPFDYTEWQKNLLCEPDVDELSSLAMKEFAKPSEEEKHK